MKKLLIVGLGSIGRRHTENFSKYFEEIDIVDINPDRIKQASNEFSINNSFSDFDVALDNHSYDVVAITTPPHLHLPIAKKAALNGSHLFIEKPLGMNTDGWQEVSDLCKSNKLISYVAYCHRHINLSQRFKEIVNSDKYGKVIHANLRWGSYLPDWHPYEDYRSFYMAKKDQGGGALMDESHGIDMVRYILGDIKEVFAIVDTVSDLEISSDDVAFLTLRLKSNTIVHINFDLVARTPRLNFELVCSKGTIIWDRVTPQLKIYSAQTREWSIDKYTNKDVLSMYPKQAEYFINSIKEETNPMNTINDALNTQMVIDAAFKSSSSGRLITLSEKDI